MQRRPNKNQLWSTFRTGHCFLTKHFVQVTSTAHKSILIPTSAPRSFVGCSQGFAQGGSQRGSPRGAPRGSPRGSPRFAMSWSVPGNWVRWAAASSAAWSPTALTAPFLRFERRRRHHGWHRHRCRACWERCRLKRNRPKVLGGPWTMKNYGKAVMNFISLVFIFIDVWHIICI
jgi:hypothetical protein